ncbi:hypothetical protein FGO68_gene885 [Halteria grandinella]|uniref:Casein kinase I n=1 Tax=Halteria grandinella TaxID=5974 RepID=A0A8J8NYH4_HALGN|nr:hypothetical protein FGO68_gene885 [Halteria grandinella]
MGFVGLCSCDKYKDPCIVKLEKKVGSTHQINEITFYSRFAHSTQQTSQIRKRITCVPRYVEDGTLEGGQRYLVTEYMNCKNLQEYVMEQAFGIGQNQSIESIAQACFEIFPSIIDAVQELHLFYLLHRDLKPHNLLVNVLEKGEAKVILIDFGTVINYKVRNGSHIEQKGGKSRIGSAFFASPFTHQGFNQSRRDDIISLVFSIIYMIDKELVSNWVTGLDGKTGQEVWDQLYQKKIEFLDSEYLESTMPIHHFLQGLLRKVMNLDFAAMPEYEEYKKMAKIFQEKLQKLYPRSIAVQPDIHESDLNTSIKLYIGSDADQLDGDLSKHVEQEVIQCSQEVKGEDLSAGPAPVDQYQAQNDSIQADVKEQVSANDSIMNAPEQNITQLKVSMQQEESIQNHSHPKSTEASPDQNIPPQEEKKRTSTQDNINSINKHQDEREQIIISGKRESISIAYLGQFIKEQPEPNGYNRSNQQQAIQSARDDTQMHQESITQEEEDANYLEITRP